MRYLQLSILCLFMNGLFAGQGVTTPQEQPQKEEYPLPGENNQIQDDDVVDQPDYAQ